MFTNDDRQWFQRYEAAPLNERNAVDDAMVEVRDTFRRVHGFDLAFDDRHEICVAALFRYLSTSKKVAA